MSDAPPLEIEVYLQPPPPAALRGAAVVVLDIFRATTVHAALFAGGARAVYPVPDLAAGVGRRDQLAAELPRCVLIGEVGALPPAEADYGNSPTEFAARNVDGWTVVHMTSNGTRALLGAAAADCALSGCLRNRSAALAYLLARGAARIAIVCSGDHGGAAPSVEDGFAAGAYVAQLRRRRPAVQLHGGARLALQLYRAYGRAPARAFADSPHGDRLQQLGFSADFPYAGAVDVDATVIRLGADEQGRAVLRAVG